jgi:glycosyltransferase involved in cell wall biosynthesis
VLVDMSPGGVEPLVTPLVPQLPRLRRLRPRRRLSRPLALNCGIAAARAPAIALLDDDNLYDPEHLDRLLRGLAATAADWVYTGVRVGTYDAGGRRLACREEATPYDPSRLWRTNFIFGTGSAYRRALWQRLGGYDRRFVVFEDWDFILRAAPAARIVHLPVVSGESRKFTGRDGVFTFELEGPAMRRCYAGILWKHRRLYGRDELRGMRLGVAAYCRNLEASLAGAPPPQLADWRLAAARDLLAWWCHSLHDIARPWQPAAQEVPC